MRRLASFIAMIIVLFLSFSIIPGEAMTPLQLQEFSFSNWLKSTPQPGMSSMEDVKSISSAEPIGGRSFEDTRPAIAFNSQDNEYLVVYESQRDDPGPGPSDILGRRVGMDGTPLGSTLYLATASSSNLYAPDIAYNSTLNQYLLVYQSEHYQNDVYAQLLQGDGSPTGGSIFIAETEEEDLLPKVAYNVATNEYLVVWQTFSGGELGDYNVYSRRVSATGGLSGSQLLITTNMLDDVNPAVAAGQGYLVTWQAESGDEIFDIRGRRLANNGGFLDDSELPFANQDYNQANPRVAYDPDNYSFMVVWQYDYYGNGVDWDIYGQRVYTSGGLAGNAFTIDGTSISMINPDVAYHPNAHEYMVAFEYLYSLADPDVYFRRMDGDGNLLEGVINLATSGGKETRPRLAADNAWSYLTVWEDNRAGITDGTDIYGDLAKLQPLSGQVWAGGVGTQTTPVAGVTLSLYCSTDSNLGTLIESRQTDGSGSFVLPVAGYCPYYDIVETDLLNYVSAGVTSEAGTIVNENRIRYTWPLEGKTLDANNFYDHPPSGITHCNSCDDCTAKLSGGYSLVYLDSDISTQNSTCINFATSNTTFDCQLHKITGVIQGGESYHGINMAFRAQNTVRSCQIKGFPTGITLQNSSYITIAGNVLSNNGSGLYLNGSNNNKINENMVVQNNDGMALWSANNNALSSNTVCKNQRDIVLPNANSGNTRIGGYCDAIYGWNWDGSNPPPTPEWCDQTCTPNDPTTCSSAQDCLDKLKGNHNLVTLQTNLSLPEGLPVTGNHLTLDCNGHSISGNGSGAGITLEDRLDVSVQNCTVQNYNTGIELRDTSLSDVLQNNTRNNSIGIALTGINPLYVPRQNVVSMNMSYDNTMYGLWLNNVLDNDISSNSLTGNGNYGLWVSGSCNNVVTNNTSGQGSSMLYMHDQSNGGTIDGVNYSEIVLCNVQNTLVRNITMDSGTSQGDGIVVLNGGSIQLRNNTLNHTNGIYVTNTQGMTIADNLIQNSRRNALELNNCSGCMVSNNRLEQNPGVIAGTGTGLSVSNSSPQLQIINNTVMTNSVGIWLQDIASPYLSGNTIRYNTSTGLLADGTDGVAFHNNTVRNNGYGVELDYQSSSNMQNNTICYNQTLDILNQNTNSTGSGNTCVKVSNWIDTGQSSPGCSQKCIGWYHFQYGYSFPNTSKSWLSFGCPYGGCQGDYVDTFGESQVYKTLDVCIGIPVCLPFVGCTCLGYEAKVPTPFPEANAFAYYFAAYGYAASPGSCQGMSTTSLRFFYGDRLVTEYGPSAQKVSDLAYYGKLEDAIDAAQGANRSVELLKNFMVNVGSTQPNTVLEQVRQSLAQGKPGIIIEYHLGGGHAVVATDVRDVDATTARIYIYDSNYPAFSTQYAENEDQYTYITIHTDTNSWDYDHKGDNDQIWFIPYNIVAGNYTLPISWEGDIFAAWGDATSLVTDQANRRLGWQGSQLVSEIPQAAPYPQIGDTNAYDPTRGLYILPRGTYTATLTGSGSGSYNAAVFAGNQMLMVEDVASTAATHDRMVFYHEYDDPPSGGFAFTSIDATKPFTATISERFESSDSTRLYRLKDCMTVPGYPALFSITPDFNSLRFTNRSASSMSCTVELQNTMARSSQGMDQGFPTATRIGVVVPGMTTALFTPSDWLDLNHATINMSLNSCGDHTCNTGEDPAGCPEDCQQPACVTPIDDLHIISNTVLCKGSYILPDQGSLGVISVDVNDITLDCNGARLVGNGSGVGILAAGKNNVTITGCTIQGYAAGLGLKDSIDAQVQSSAVISNTVSGINAIGSQGMLIRQNYMATNQVGIVLTGSSVAELSSNFICGNSSLDVSAASITGSVGEGNRCQSTLGWSDQGSSTCTYPCSLRSGKFYLPLVKK